MAVATGTALLASAAVGAAGGVYQSKKASKAAKKAAKTAGQAADFQYDIAQREVSLAEQQYTDQKALFDEYSPMLRELLQTNLTQQQKSIEQSDDAWASYTNTWRPVESALAQRSMEMADPARAEADAQRAAASTAEQFDVARQEQTRALQASGADASTIAALGAAGQLEEAKAKAGASDSARRSSELAGLSVMDNAARFGRNMPSQGLATAGMALQQGQAAQGGFNNLSMAQAQPAQQAAALYNSAGSNAGASGALGLNAGQMLAGAHNQSAAMFGDITGAALGAYGYYTSSKKTKKTGGKVKGASDAVEKSPAKKWAYKPGEGDGNTKDRMGPMAEDLKKVAPEVSDGKMVDAVAMAGLHHAAIGEQNQRLKRIEKRLGLAEA
jgi:hypothetical protein